MGGQQLTMGETTSTKDTTMQIRSFQVRDFLAIEDATIALDGSVTLIGGRNGAGKSSLFTALCAALGGKGAVPERPVREGADGKATVQVWTTDGVTVEASIDAERKYKVEIKNSDGFKVGRPAEWLKERFGSLDGLSLLAMDATKQAATIRDLAGLDTNDLDAAERAAREERTLIGREAKTLKAAAEAMPFHADAPGEPVSAEYIEAEMAAARAANDRNDEARRAAREAERQAALMEDEAFAQRDRAEQAKARVEQAEAALTTATAQSEQADEAANKADADAAALVDIDIEPFRRRIAEIEAEMAAARATNERNAEERSRLRAVSSEAAPAYQALERAEDTVDESRREASAADERAKDSAAEAAAARMAAREAEAAALELVDADLAPIRERLDSIGATNRKVEDNARAAEAERVAERKAADYAAMTARIEALQAERAARIAAAALPVDGLGFDADGGMTFRGLPFAQASMAERMRVALAVAMRRDPRPPVLFISDAALLDDDSLAAVREAAEEHGVHVLIERVGDRDPGAVVIECGRVRS